MNQQTWCRSPLFVNLVTPLNSVLALNSSLNGSRFGMYINAEFCN